MTEKATLADRARATWEEVQHSIASKGYVDEGHRGAFDSIISQIAALEANAKPDESLKALEAAVVERRTDLVRIKAEGIAEHRGAKEMMAQTGIATCEWFLKLIAEAKQEMPKEMRAE